MRLLLVSLAAFFLALFPMAAHPQWVAPGGVQGTRSVAIGLEPVVREISASRSVWRGALIGGITLGAIAAVLAVTADGACIGCAPAIILAPIAVGTGAILGAAVGYVVYRVRRSRPAKRRSFGLSSAAGEPAGLSPLLIDSEVPLHRDEIELARYQAVGSDTDFMQQHGTHEVRPLSALALAVVANLKERLEPFDRRIVALRDDAAQRRFVADDAHAVDLDVAVHVANDRAVVELR